MQMGFRASLIALASVLAGIALGLQAPLAGAQDGESYTAPRTADGRPDLNGFWQALNTAHFDLEAHPARPAMALIPAPAPPDPPGLDRATPVELPAPAVRALGAVGGVPAGESVVVGGTIPYQPWAAAMQQDNAANWLERDPEIRCFMPGVPRATYMPYPFQILQGSDQILIAYEFSGTTRIVHMNDVGTSPAPTWMGWSRGRWDGDTLVVETTNLRQPFIRRWARPEHSLSRGDLSETARVTERFTRTGPDTLHYEFTVDDPETWTRPWSGALPYARADGPMFEFACHEGNYGMMNMMAGSRAEEAAAGGQ